MLVMSSSSSASKIVSFVVRQDVKKMMSREQLILSPPET